MSSVRLCGKLRLLGNRGTRGSQIRREVSDFLWRLCCAAGIIGGLLWGLHHQPRVVCAGTASHDAVIEQCANHSISVSALHWLVAPGGGVLVGAGVGAALAFVVRPKAA